jgi:hypothetical protein
MGALPACAERPSCEPRRATRPRPQPQSVCALPGRPAGKSAPARSEARRLRKRATALTARHPVFVRAPSGWASRSASATPERRKPRRSRRAASHVIGATTVSCCATRTTGTCAPRGIAFPAVAALGARLTRSKQRDRWRPTSARECRPRALRSNSRHSRPTQPLNPNVRRRIVAHTDRVGRRR